MDFTLTAGADTISRFGSGCVQLSIPYTLQSGESAAGVVVWYLDETGAPQPVECTYDDGAERVIFRTNHFSRFLLGYSEMTATANELISAASLLGEDGLRVGYELKNPGETVLENVRIFAAVYGADGRMYAGARDVKTVEVNVPVSGSLLVDTAALPNSGCEVRLFVLSSGYSPLTVFQMEPIS